MSGIGTLKESSLHASLKAWAARPGDLIEATVEGYQIDVLRGGLLIEVQTGNFSSLKPKLTRLLASHAVHVIHPIAINKWVARLDAPGGKELSRRRSPAHGRAENLFSELVRLAHLVEHPNFSLEVVYTQEEELRAWHPNGSWRRRGWRTFDRRLLAVSGSQRFDSPADYLALLPQELYSGFDTRQLARRLGLPRYLAQKMAYCLHVMGLLERSKRGRAYVYRCVHAAGTRPAACG